jgi:hypothetical protein
MRMELLEIDVVRGLLESPVVVRALFFVCYFVNKVPLLGILGSNQLLLYCARLGGKHLSAWVIMKHFAHQGNR